MPRTETKTRTLFTFDELSDTAKEKARDWWRQTNDTDADLESSLEDAEHVAELLGITLSTRPIRTGSGNTYNVPRILYSGFSSQGDGACFEGSYQYRAGSVVSIKNHAPADTTLHAIAEGLAKVQYENQNSLEASVRHRGRYYHEHCTEIDVFGDIDNETLTEETAEKVKELLRNFMRWIYRQLEADYNYRMSDENVDESIQANRYEFTEDGQIA